MCSSALRAGDAALAGVPADEWKKFHRTHEKVPCRNQPLVPRFTGNLRSDRVRGDDPCLPRNFADKDAADKGRQGSLRAAPKTIRRKPAGGRTRPSAA